MTLSTQVVAQQVGYGCNTPLVSLACCYLANEPRRVYSRVLERKARLAHTVTKGAGRKCVVLLCLQSRLWRNRWVTAVTLHLSHWLAATSLSSLDGIRVGFWSARRCWHAQRQRAPFERASFSSVSTPRQYGLSHRRAADTETLVPTLDVTVVGV